MEIINEQFNKLATKDDLKNLATKDDVREIVKEETEGLFTAINKDFNAVEKKLNKLDGIERKLDKLDSIEKLARATFALIVDEDKKKKEMKPSVELVQEEIKEVKHRLERLEKAAGFASP